MAAREDADWSTHNLPVLIKQSNRFKVKCHSTEEKNNAQHLRDTFLEQCLVALNTLLPQCPRSLSDTGARRCNGWSQTSTGTDIPILLTTTPITPFRRCCHTYNNVRCRNMKRTRKNAPHYAAQNASANQPENKHKYK